MSTQSYGVRPMMHIKHEHGEHEQPVQKNPFCDRPEEQVFNLPHYHAFLLLGKERLFASHLTQSVLRGTYVPIHNGSFAAGATALGHYQGAGGASE